MVYQVVFQFSKKISASFDCFIRFSAIMLFSLAFLPLQAYSTETEEKIAAPDTQQESAEEKKVKSKALRIHVKHFSVLGVIDHPREGISKSEIETFLNKRRLEQKQGFTLEELQETALSITRYYRKAGYILAQTILPEQDISDGKISFKVYEGLLGKIVTRGNDNYSKQILEYPFQSLIGKSVHYEPVENAMLHIKDYPGLSVKGIFQPGDAVGTTNLLLDIEKEKKFLSTIIVDNYGTKLTGKERILLGTTWNNPLKRADKLAVNVLQTSSASSNTFGSVYYQYPFQMPSPWLEGNYLLGMEYSRNSFEIGQQLADLDISGVSQTAHLFVQRSFLRSRKNSYYSRIKFERKSSETTQADTTIGEDTLSILSINMNMESIDPAASMIYTADFQYSHGFAGLFGAMDKNGNKNSSRVGGSDDYAGGSFDKFSWNYSQLHALNEWQTLLFRMKGQYSNDLLVSMEQMPLGGPNTVRAYPTSELLFDTAIFFSLEWTFNLTRFTEASSDPIRLLNERIDIAVYADFASGNLNDPLFNETKSSQLKGIGVSFILKHKHKYPISSRFDIATPVSSAKASNNLPLQTHFNLAYQF